jgi:hypothetical protein
MKEMIDGFLDLIGGEVEKTSIIYKIQKFCLEKKGVE